MTDTFVPIKLGQKVRDRMTGLEGIAICRMDWLYGCTRVVIQPQEIKDGKPAESYTVDEPQCEVIGEDFVPEQIAARAAAPAAGRHGGGRAAATRPDPSR